MTWDESYTYILEMRSTSEAVVARCLNSDHLGTKLFEHSDWIVYKISHELHRLSAKLHYLVGTCSGSQNRNRKLKPT
jgi:hypothetical protein